MTASTRPFLEKLFAKISETGFQEPFLASLSDDVIWRATGDSPLAGVYRGKSEYIDKVLKPLHNQLVASPRPTVDRIIVEGDWAAVQFTSEGARAHNGADFSMTYCWLIKVVDERIVEVVGFYDQKKMYDIFA